MHSRVFQVSNDSIMEKITEESFCERYDRTFFMGIADYVSSMSLEDEKDSFDWLAESPGLDVSGKVLTIKDRREFFSWKYKEFLEAIKETETKSLDQFVGLSFEYDLYRLEKLARDKYGFYILDSSSEELMPLDDFIRLHADGDSFHLGAVLDYHF